MEAGTLRFSLPNRIGCNHMLSDSPFMFSSPYNFLHHSAVTGDPVGITPRMDRRRVVAHDCRVFIPEAQKRNFRGIFDLVTSRRQRQ